MAVFLKLFSLGVVLLVAMKKIFIIIIAIFVISGVYYFLNLRRAEAPVVLENKNQLESVDERIKGKSEAKNNVETEIKIAFQPPLPRAGERVTKKPFGIFVTPKNSPVQPEKFHGYHTGTDFEIFPEEADEDVEVKAICSGELKIKKTASGYGGVVVQACELNKSPITVIYGHLKLASINFSVGENIEAGKVMGILGRGYGMETGGERKHLHLGIHKGSEVNILGYVQEKSNLTDWIDACPYLCLK